MEKVNFKNVARAIRFDLLGSIQAPTPCEFESLSEAEKLALYRSLFDVFYDTCTLLSSALNTEKLLSKYDVEFKD